MWSQKHHKLNGLLVKVLFFLIMTGVSTTLISQTEAQAAGKTLSLNQVKTYNIYYGGPTPQMMEEAGRYDLLILEPRNFTKKEIAQIKQKGTLVYGYIALVEKASWMKDILPQLQASDYILNKGQKVSISDGIWLMDMSQPHYQKILKDEIKRQIVDQGFDGMFLDALGDIEYWFKDSPTQMEKHKKSMFNFLQGIRQSYPSIKMIQSGGSDLFRDYTGPIMDAFMWENLPYDWAIKSDDAQSRIQMLQQAMKKRGLVVFTIVPNEPQKQASYRYSKEKGFIPYISICPGVVWALQPTIK